MSGDVFGGSHVPADHPNRLRTLISLVILAGVILTVAAGCGSGEDESADADDVAEPDPTPTPTLEELESLVLREIRSLMEIATATHSAETVVEQDADRGFLTGDKLLLVAYGSVTGGVDLSDLSDMNVEASSYSSVRVLLPQSKILESDLDEDRTEVIDRDTGLFGSQDDDLETEALDAAREQVKQSACEHGLLDRAAQQAEDEIATTLSMMGFEDIVVEAAPGACP